MASSSSVSSSERRRRRKFIKNTKIFEGGGDSESSAAEFSDDDGRRTIENDNGDGANEATEFTIYDNRHHEEHYHDIVDDASYGTNHSLRMSLAARRKKLASMNSVGSLTDGGSIEGGSLREVRRKRRDRSGSLQSLDGSLLGGSWKDIFNASWTGSLVKKKKKKKTKDKKKEKKKKKKDEKKKSSKDRKAALSDKKSSGERRHENKDEEYDRKRRVKSKKENLSGKDGKERVDFSKGKEFRRSTNKHEEKKVLKKRRDDSSSSDSSLSSDFDASTMGSTIDMNSKKAFIYVDRSNVKDEKHNRIPGGGERRRITVDGSESERSRNRRFNPNSHRRISDGALINGTERRRALKTSSDSKLGDVKVSSIGTSVAGTTNSACDEVTGTCVFHPEIQLKKRSKLGGWKDVLRQCPKCIHAGSTSGPYDHRDARQAVHKRREVTDPRMAYSGVARGDIRIDRGRDKGRDDDRLRSASHSLTRRRIPPDRSMHRGDPAGSVKKTSSNRRADLIRQRHMASVQQNHRKDHHHRQPSYDSEFGKNHADSRRLEPHDMGKEKKYLHEAVKTRSSKQSGRDTYGVPPGSSSRNTKESHSTLKRQTSDKSKQFNYSAPVLDSQTKNSQLLQDAIAKERRRASTGEGPISKLKPTKESSPYSFKKQPISRSQPEGDCDNSLNEKKQQQKLRSTEEISVEHENYNHGPYISKQNHSHIEQQFSLMGIEKARFEGLSNQDANQEVNSNEEFKQFTFSLSSTGARANSFSEEYTGHGNGVEKISVARHAKSFDHILFPSRNTRSTENAKKMSSVDEECDVFESKQEQNPSPSMQRQNRSSGDGIDLSPSSKRQVDSKKFTSSLSGLDSPLNPKPKTVVTNLEWSVKGFSGLYSGEVNKKFEPHGEGELALADGISIRMKWINGYPVKDEENETMKESGEHPKKTEAATSCNHVGQDIQVEELDVHVEEKLDHMKEQSARGTQMSLEHVDQEGSRGEDSIPCYHIGDEGRRRDMMKDNDKDVALMRIASLQPKDNAFIRRTDGSWSYAEVKKITPDTIVFFASSKGATKAYIRKYWVSHIRVPKAEILPASKSRGNDDGSKEKDPVREEPAHLLNRFSVANVKAKVDDEQITDGRPTSILRTGRSFADRNSDHNGRRRRRRSVSFSPLRNEYEISSHTGETDDDEDEDCVGYQRFVTIDDSLVGSGYDLRGVEPL